MCGITHLDRIHTKWDFEISGRADFQGLAITTLVYPEAFTMARAGVKIEGKMGSRSCIPEHGVLGGLWILHAVRCSDYRLCIGECAVISHFFGYELAEKFSRGR